MIPLAFGGGVRGAFTAEGKAVVRSRNDLALARVMVDGGFAPQWQGFGQSCSQARFFFDDTDQREGSAAGKPQLEGPPWLI
jgi:hypothetical protein